MGRLRVTYTATHSPYTMLAADVLISNLMIVCVLLVFYPTNIADDLHVKQPPSMISGKSKPAMVLALTGARIVWTMVIDVTV